MLYGEERSDYRKIIFDIWKKYKNNDLLNPFETSVLQIIQEHPEYHRHLENEDANIDKNFHAAVDGTNPFLHLALHLAVLEQVSVDRPKGIRQLFMSGQKRFQDTHKAYHCIMNSLAITMHKATEDKTEMDDKSYLRRIKIALKKGYW